MSTKKKLFTAAFALLIVSVVALAAVLGVVYHKVKAFDKKHGSDVLANLSPKELFDNIIWGQTPRSSSCSTTSKTAVKAPYPGDRPHVAWAPKSV